MNDELVIGVDVGTGSVRSGVFTLSGRKLGYGVAPLEEWNPREGIYEQSSQQVWDACGAAVRESLVAAGVKGDSVVGIGFDATCSMVLLGDDDVPVTVSESGEDRRNIVEWRDHRAQDQARRINEGGYTALRYVGGTMSPEQQPPKLMWLKENLPSSWSRARKALDLADFMVYMACGRDVRSECTTGCKWAYLTHEGRWDRGLYEGTGMGDALERGLCGSEVAPLGTKAGCLTPQASAHLGLSAGCCVGVGVIDAHAGAIGLCAGQGTLALITGTSSCHMMCSEQAIFVGGVWGPYLGAVLPGMWLSEGGQSATGALIDHTVERFGLIKGEDGKLRHVTEGTTLAHVYQDLNAFLGEQGKGCEYATGVHVLPEHHGNRSPYADPHAKGMVDGLTLDMSYAFLAKIYLATVQAVAYGTRHIVSKMEGGGHKVERVSVCGGGAKNEVWLQEHADALQCPLATPDEPEAVMLGAAILASVPGKYASVREAQGKMCRDGRKVEPNVDARVRAYHDAKYAHQLQMYQQQLGRRKDAPA